MDSISTQFCLGAKVLYSTNHAVSTYQQTQSDVQPKKYMVLENERLEIQAKRVSTRRNRFYHPVT